MSQTDGGNYISLSPTKLPFLAGFTKMFDRYVYHRIRIVYRPSCGSTTSGSLIVGIDWDSKKSANLTYKVISNLTPVMDLPLWQGGTLVLPPSKLMTRKEYIINTDDTDEFDSTPGFVCFAATGATAQTAGHLWIDYDISFFGTKVE